KIAEQLAAKNLQSVDVRIFVEKAESGFVDFLRRVTPSKFKTTSLSIDVQNMDVQKGRVLVADDFDIPSEVDEFWTKLRTRVVPLLSRKRRSAVVVLARLSEPPELRRRIEEAARAELVKAGADERGTSVSILSAYKQGYSWL